MIRTDIVPTAELRQHDVRLDGSYYCSDGAQTRKLLAGSRLPTQHLIELCLEDGLYIPHRFKRPYVRKPEYGVPYITGSAIGLADPLQGCDYLSSHPRLLRDRDRLMLQPNTILITCSGDTGNTVYVNDLFVGTIGSPDLLRVVPDEREIQSGYLYAFLASPMGKGLLTQGTYGGVIPHIETCHVVDLPVPRFDPATEQAIHECIQRAAAKRVEANRLLCEADRSLHDTVDLPVRFSVMHDHSFAFGSVRPSDLARAPYRLDAYFHTGYAGEAKDWRSDKWPMLSLGSALSRIFNPPIFKRIRAEKGVPYLLGAEVYQAHPRPSTRIAWSTPNLSEYLLQRDMIAFEDAGQRYGLLGTPVFIGRTVAGNAATNNMTRIVSRSRDDAGYVFALLNSEFGRRMIVRQSYGTSLPHILPDWIAALQVPWPGDDERRAVAKLVLEAVDLRDEANDLEDEAQEMLRQALDAAVGSEPSKPITVGG